MNYESALEYIHAVQWAGHKPGLSRTRTLLAALGSPHKRLKFVLRQSHLQCSHSFQRADRAAVAERQLCNFTFLTKMPVDTVFLDWDTEHLAC